jgi:hypothetical protein
MNQVRRRCTSQLLQLLALAGLTVQPVAAAPQGRLLDKAVFVISRGSAEIGREELSVHQGRPSESGGGFVGTGYSVSTAAYYPAHRSYATAASVVQFDSDSQPSSARMDLEGSGQPNVFVDFTARRITVRTRTSAGESASQFPRSPRLLVVDDSLLAVFAVLPGQAPGAVTLFYPRTGRRHQAPLEDLGTEATLFEGGERQLRHWTLGSGELLRHLWYDSLGRLMKIEMPSERLTAIRSPR